MGSVYTKRIAKKCAVILGKAGCKPETVLNLGAGSFAEIRVWRQWFSEACMVVVDPKEIRPEALSILKSWKRSAYVQAAIDDGSSSVASFCVRCSSTVCKKPEEHKRRRKHAEVPTITVDDLAQDWPSPYFIWMDIDGGELRALAGASETLKKTEWMCVELFDWIPGHAGKVFRSLKRNGFRMKYRFQHDGLFCKDERR